MISFYITPSISYSNDIAYYQYIKSQNHRISDHEAKKIIKAIKYYQPRYFSEEGIDWTLSIIAAESSFRNVLGDMDKGISHGYMQIQKPTCDDSRKYNNIKRELDLNTIYGNIHCGMSFLNFLHERYDENFIYAIIAYNNGHNAVDRWIRNNNIDGKTQYLSRVLEKKYKLDKIKLKYLDKDH